VTAKETRKGPILRSRLSTADGARVSVESNHVLHQPQSAILVQRENRLGMKLDRLHRQLAVANPEALPDEFVLALSSDGAARRRCRVTWRAEDSIGVEFLKDLKKSARAIRPPVASEPAPPTVPQALEDQFDIDSLSAR